MPSVLRGSFEHHLKGVAYRLRGTLSARKTRMLQPKQFCQRRNAKCCITLISTSSIRHPCRKRISSLSGAREAEASLGAKKAGVVIDLWKCVGSRRVVAVANVDGPDTLDQILLDLPIMKEHGQHVQIDVTPLRRFEDFATDLKERA